MAVRGLIIAIQEYPDADGIARELEGTADDGDTFRRWLIETKGVQPVDVLYCCEPGRAERTHSTKREAIADAIEALVSVGRDRTEELYVFFSGHGFAYKERRGRKPVDILLGSDFRRPQSSGTACLQLQEVQEKIQAAMGPGHHYYFVDACRNELDEGDINPIELGRTLRLSKLGTDCLFTLYSTGPGRKADVRSGFAELLLGGLKGAGRAKRWHRGEMQVTFDRLREYVRKGLEQKADAATDGGCDGVILQLDTVPESRCHVRVINGTPADQFHLVVTELRQGSSNRFAFRGPEHEVPLPPDDYDVQLEEGARIQPPPPDPVDLFDSTTVEFAKVSRLRAGAPSPSPGPATLSVVGPGGTRLRTTHSGTGEETQVDFDGRAALERAPGTYRVELLERGRPIATREVTLGTAGGAVDLRRGRASPLQERLMEATFNDPQGETVDFSESLGPMASRETSLWLTIFGAARILAPRDEFSKIRALPLETFDDARADEGAFYVLVQLADSAKAPHVQFSRPIVTEPRRLEPVGDFPGLWQLRGRLLPGPQLLSCLTEDRVVRTVVSHALPNRATLVTLTEAEEDPGELEIHQYLLPIHSLRDRLDPEVVCYLDESPLEFVRFMWQVQYWFARKYKIEPSDQDEEFWELCMYGKWLDPMMSIFAAYELIRRGRMAEDKEGLLAVVVENLRRFFSGIPDTEMIATLRGQLVPPESPPMIRDGFLRWQQSSDHPLPLPGSQLSYEGPWTAWRTYRGEARDEPALRFR